MRGGTLRQAGMLQDRSFGVDDHGGQVPAWKDVQKVRFSLETLGGKEAEAGGAVRAESTYKIEMRWLPNVSSTMRIKMDDGRCFNFTNVNDILDRHRDLEITAMLIKGQDLG